MMIGAMVGPEAFTEVRYLAHRQHARALQLIPEVGQEFEEVFGRPGMGLVRPYRASDADVVVVAVGSVLGSLADVVDELREDGVSVGALGITCYRPWPFDEVRAALSGASRVVVLNRAVAVGSGSILGQDVRLSVPAATPVHDVVLGLGGRAVTRDGLRRLVRDVVAGAVPSDCLTFYDLDERRAAAELDAELDGGLVSTKSIGASP
jgi:pyruvate ferredoxin oxidoreductase alpha subunit